MRKTILILTVAAVAASCSNRITAPLTESYRETLDSVAIIHRRVDVAIPGERSESVVPAGDTARAETSVARAEAWVDSSTGTLHQVVRNRDDRLMSLDIDVPVSVHSERESIVRTEVREVKKPPSLWDRTLRALGWAMIATVALALAGALFKHRSNTITTLTKRLF